MIWPRPVGQTKSAATSRRGAVRNDLHGGRIGSGKALVFWSFFWSELVFCSVVATVPSTFGALDCIIPMVDLERVVLTVTLGMASFHSILQGRSGRGIETRMRFM
jgi:hypothetical protein